MIYSFREDKFEIFEASQNFALEVREHSTALFWAALLKAIPSKGSPVCSSTDQEVRAYLFAISLTANQKTRKRCGNTFIFCSWIFSFPANFLVKRLCKANFFQENLFGLLPLNIWNWTFPISSSVWFMAHRCLGLPEDLNCSIVSLVFQIKNSDSKLLLRRRASVLIFHSKQLLSNNFEQAS